MDISTYHPIKLKLKYRNPNSKRMGDGTLVYLAGTFKSKVSNSGSKTNQAKQGTAHRLRQGWGSVWQG